MLFLMGAAIAAHGQETDPSDPLKDNHNVVKSNELATLWSDPDHGGTLVRKLYDYVSFGNQAIDDSLQAQGRQETSGEFGLDGDEVMDAVIGDFDGSGTGRMISMWEGADSSIVVSMPSTDL